MMKEPNMLELGEGLGEFSIMMINSMECTADISINHDSYLLDREDVIKLKDWLENYLHYCEKKSSEKEIEIANKIVDESSLQALADKTKEHFQSLPAEQQQRMWDLMQAASLKAMEEKK